MTVLTISEGTDWINMAVTPAQRNIHQVLGGELGDSVGLLFAVTQLYRAVVSPNFPPKT
jgi:hypothetical protein